MKSIQTIADTVSKFFDNRKTAKLFSWSLIGLMILAVSANILYKAGWVLGDDSQFMTNTISGKYKSIWDDIRSSGRFFPLGLWDVNLTLLIPYGNTAIGHYSIVAFECILSIICLVFLFKNTDIDKNKSSNIYINTLYLLLSFFIINGLITTTMEIIFPERILFLTLPLFMFLYLKGLKTQKSLYYVLALIPAFYSTYCKEPVFGAFGIIILINILFGYKQLTKKDWLFNCALLINALIFLILYYFVVYRNSMSFYSYHNTDSLLSFTIATFTSYKILIFIFVLGIIRGCSVLFGKDKSHLYYDGLLFAGIGYMLVYIKLRFKGDYLYIPITLLALPSIVYWTKYLYKKKKTATLLTIIPILLIALYNIPTIEKERETSLWKRENTMKSMELINETHKNNKTLYWYEGDDEGTLSNLNISSEELKKDWKKSFLLSQRNIRNWQKVCVNAFLSYMNEEPVSKDFFVTIKTIKKLEAGDLLFYSKKNDFISALNEDENALIQSNFIEKTVLSSFSLIIVYEYSPE